MTQPLAFLNGQLVPAAQALISVTDGGFVQGVTVAEQLRTFGGKLFRLDRHLQRLKRSLEIVGVDPGITGEQMESAAEELIRHNHKLLASGDDLGLTMFVTPGIYSAYSAAATGLHSGPTVGMHTMPIPFHLWNQKYDSGEALAVTDIRQVPNACWPAELKCRSRMHYYLADREARAKFAGARALLLDEQGLVTESSTANVLIFTKQAGLISPPRESILPGVSVAVVEELAGKIGIPFLHRPLTVADVASADEVLLCSTSPCVWGVSTLNGQPIGNGKPGPISRALLTAWSLMVGHDILAQAHHFGQISR